MNYSYTINKILPKAEFMSVTYSADGYPDFRRNFNPVDFNDEKLIQMIKDAAPFVIDFWMRWENHPEEYQLANGSDSAEPPRQLNPNHAPRIEERPIIDQFTQKLVLKDIEDPWQETVGWDIVDLTEEEKAAALISYTNVMRNERNRLLFETDYAFLSDAPPPSQEMIDYRQALRDVPQQEGFPKNIIWPQKP